MGNMFYEQFVDEALTRIGKFGAMMDSLGEKIHVGFSGGKDSLVVLDLCRKAGIKYTAVFNHAFESPTTLKYIREHFPEVEWHRNRKEGFITNMVRQGFAPDPGHAYCCKDFKHPADSYRVMILGVRREESKKRSGYNVFTVKNKTTRKRSRDVISDYFEEHCVAEGAPHVFTLYPILDWTEELVWDYIRINNLPLNDEYSHCKRVGCMVCVKADIIRNAHYLMAYPKLIDAFIRMFDETGCDWLINKDGIKYKNNKPLFVLRWLNYGFREFTERQRMAAERILDVYTNQRTKKDNRHEEQHNY